MGREHETSAERLMSTLLVESRSIPPSRFVDLIGQRTRQFLGATDVAVYLVDLAQRALVPLPARGEAGGPLDVEGTLAGRAYRSGQALSTGVGEHVRIWTPLINGSERLGVIGMTLEALDDVLGERIHHLAALVSEILVAKNRYGDLFHQIRRRAETSIAAELQWTMLPPLTSSIGNTVVSGILEPAYDIGGDTFDYAFNDDTVHLGLFDAMGHGLSAALTASVAIAGYRHARRENLELEDMYRVMDAAVAKEFPERFVTAQVARLNSLDGRLQWLNAGHPPPLLVRDSSVVGELSCEPTLPIGLADPVTKLADAQLQPGDRVFFFTDGLVEARSPSGKFFGQDRLVEFLERQTASGEPAPEILRRLSRTIIDYQDGAAQDDATTVFLEWHPSGSSSD